MIVKAAFLYAFICGLAMMVLGAMVIMLISLIPSDDERENFLDRRRGLAIILFGVFGAILGLVALFTFIKTGQTFTWV